MEAAAELFLGTWSYLVDGDPPWTDYSHFSNKGLTCWCFAIPSRRQPQVLWFKVEPPDTLHFGHPPNHTGWTRQYRFENNDRFVMSCGDKSWIYNRIAPEEVPDWVTAAIDAALKE